MHYFVRIEIKEVTEATPPVVDRYGKPTGGTDRKIVTLMDTSVSRPTLQEAASVAHGILGVITPIDNDAWWSLPTHRASDPKPAVDTTPDPRISQEYK